MKYEVYKIQNKVSKKIYVGITTQGYQKRFRKHLKEVEAGSTSILHNAIRSYGNDNFFTTLLEEVNSIEELKEREQYWIKTLDTTNRDKGYNMTLGGDGTFGRLHSQETKDKIAVKATGRPSRKRVNVKVINLLTEASQTYLTLADASSAIGKGVTYLSEYRTRYRIKDNTVIIGDYKLTFSKEVFEKPIKEKKDNTEHMKKLQEKSKEVRANNPEYYKQICKNAAKSRMKAVLQLDLSGNIVNRFENKVAAIEALGIKSVSGIQHCLKGRADTAQGFQWVFEEEYNKLNKE